MDKEKKYIVPDGEDKINKAEESAEVLFGEIKSLFANAGEVEMITDVVETVCQVTPAQGFTEKGAL